MSDINLLANADDENERSLNTLARAIQLSRGQFCLILARCNYACCQERMAQQLQQRCSNTICSDPITNSHFHWGNRPTFTLPYP
ncbi:MAG: hypothetical protein RIM23_22130 [Coleofasciculus sp. G3-WIS-01]|uniref:hypothetical protein n=1 Tax=Coleofasciculus sp. G3-WIS-01 TaxID=3069528 RepID=UPI0032F7F842